MPTFAFGIQKEAEIYCSSSKLPLVSDPQANAVISQLRQAYVEDGKINLPMNEITDFIVQLCKNNVLNQIDGREDEDGVAWTIALLVKAYILVSTNPFSYDTLFKECFIKYYE